MSLFGAYSFEIVPEFL